MTHGQAPHEPGAESAPRGGFHWPTLATDALLVSGGALAANALNYVYHALLSRSLGPEAYGTLATLLGIAMIASVAGSAIGTMAMQETARMWALRHDASIAAFGRQTVRSALLLALAVAVVMAALAVPLARFLHIDDAGAWSVLVAALFAGVITAYARGAIQGAHRFGIYASSLIAEALVKVGLGVALAAAGLGVFGAMSGVALGSAMGGIIALGSLFARSQDVQSPAPFDRRAPAAIRLAIIFAASNALLYVDLVFAKHGLSSTDAGYYGAAGLMARIIPFGVGLVVPLVTPKAVAARHVSRSDLARLLSVTFGAAMLGAIVVALVMEAWPAQLITLMFGAKFAAASTVLRLYAVDATLLAFGTLAAGYLAAMGEYGIVPWMAAAVVLEAVLMAFFGDTSVKLLLCAICGNALLLAPLAYAVLRTLQPPPAQAQSPLLDEVAASPITARSSDSA